MQGEEKVTCPEVELVRVEAELAWGGVSGGEGHGQGKGEEEDGRKEERNERVAEL